MINELTILVNFFYDQKINAFKMTDKFIQSTHFVENINILIQNGDIHLKQ